MWHLSRQEYFVLFLFITSGKALLTCVCFFTAVRHCAEGFKVASSKNLVFILCSYSFSVLYIKTAPCSLRSRFPGFMPVVPRLSMHKGNCPGHFLLLFSWPKCTISFASTRNIEIIATHVNCIIFACLGENLIFLCVFWRLRELFVLCHYKSWDFNFRRYFQHEAVQQPTPNHPPHNTPSRIPFCSSWKPNPTFNNSSTLWTFFC